MQILAHRGYWNEYVLRNSSQALRIALEKGYGVESDVRDYKGKIVISHNIANDSCQVAEEVFSWLREFGDEYCFAINIKADGLKDILQDCLIKYDIKKYFLFDMSVPQMLEFRNMGLRYFTRQSEVEPAPCMYEDAAGVWIDGFWYTDWITESLVNKHLRAGKEVCLVSPDLHGREYRRFWQRVKSWDVDDRRLLYLCTDHPDEAREFWGDVK